MASRKVNITIPDINSLNLEIKLEGDWHKLNTLADNLKESVLNGFDKGVEIFSKKLLKIVRRSISTGTPPPNSGVTWAPHKPSTIDRYGEHNLLNLTGQYLRSIGLHKYKSRTLVGIPLQKSRASASGKRKTITLNKIAIILEYGNEHIPARPLYGPAYKSVGGPSGLKRELLKNIRSQLYKDTGIRPNQVRAI